MVLAAFGLAAILRDGAIFARPREYLGRVGFLGALFSCWLCLGFWTGLATGWLSGFRGRLLIFAPLVASGVVYLLGTYLSSVSFDLPEQEPVEQRTADDEQLRRE